MFKKLIITFGIILYAVTVPILEINATHVFNPGWASHIRLHEVWQLLTNSFLGVLCLWLVWFQDKLVLSAVISAIVTGGFLVAYVLRDLYGGSMLHLDGSEKTLFGYNLGVLGFGLVFVLLGFVVCFESFKKNKAK